MSLELEMPIKVLQTLLAFTVWTYIMVFEKSFSRLMFNKVSICEVCEG